jgi:uncharacterized membrane protein YeaQ/YmgE (transglycosylase-associated protein family)
MRIGHWIWYIVTGFIVGLIGRAILPGSDKMGLIGTTLVGIVGSLIGGFIGGLISKPKEGATFHPAGFFMSVVGALVLLVILRFV